MEDEYHFLVSCPVYHDLRDKFYQSISQISGGKWDFKHRSPDDAFLALMQGTGDEHEATIFRTFHCHLERCFKLRNKLSAG